MQLLTETDTYANMTASNSISISACAPSYAAVREVFISDFPPQHSDLGMTVIQHSPVWYEDNYTRPLHPSEDFRKALEKLTSPPTKFRTTESGDRILLSLDIPGVRRGGVELTIEGYVVTVKGFRQDIKEKIEETITLTQEYDVDPQEIDAWHEDGVITVAFTRKSRGPVKIGIR